MSTSEVFKFEKQGRRVEYSRRCISSLATKGTHHNLYKWVPGQKLRCESYDNSAKESKPKKPQDIFLWGITSDKQVCVPGFVLLSCQRPVETGAHSSTGNWNTDTGLIKWDSFSVFTGYSRSTSNLGLCMLYKEGFLIGEYIWSYLPPWHQHFTVSFTQEHCKISYILNTSWTILVPYIHLLVFHFCFIR